MVGAKEKEANRAGASFASAPKTSMTSARRETPFWVPNRVPIARFQLHLLRGDGIERRGGSRIEYAVWSLRTGNRGIPLG